MKTSFLLFAVLLGIILTTASAHCADTPVAPTSSPILATLKPTHPRLLASEKSWSQIKVRRAQDRELDAFLKRQESEARALLNVPPIAYNKIGRRLLDVSRTVLRRVLLLSMQYQLTGDKKLLDRAQAEMLNAAAFGNWNPSHFLDTAEMTTALALGYDWLYADLDEKTRATIAAAIRDKGLKLGLEEQSWIKATNNWNSVCHAGMVLGVLAIAENEPQMAEHFVAQAKQFNPLALKAYAPAGVYPEGPGYWAYGTTFQVLLIAALESALGTDWDLSLSEGFLPTAQAMFQSAGPTGRFFNYSDNNEFNRPYR